jgi:hypothetical protein
MRRVWQERVKEVPAASKTWRRLGTTRISRSLVEEGKSKEGGGLRREKSGEDETARKEESLGLALEIWGKSRLEAHTG